MQDEAIRINNLNGGYEAQLVLKNISLAINSGGFTAIAGPNGSGKSTLLKYLIRELKCSDNSIALFGKEINSLRQKEIAKLVSFQGQNTPKTEEFTVREAVAMGRFAHGDIESSQAIVEKAMKLTGIMELADKPITRISGGEFQLAMLARTLCQDAKVLALDEPVNNLDPRHQKMLLQMLTELANAGRTVICVLHDLNAILNYSTKCILLKDGEVFAYGKTKQVLTKENILKVYDINVEIIESGGKSALLVT